MLLLRLLDKIPFSLALIAGLFLGFAPFVPEPHLFEKARMLAQGTLHRPIDIVDLFYHGVPLALLIAKLIRMAVVARAK